MNGLALSESMGEVFDFRTGELLDESEDFCCPVCGHDKFRLSTQGLRCARARCQQLIEMPEGK